MAKNNRNPGCGTRYDQIDALEDVARAKSTRMGVFNSFICEICNKQKGRTSGVNHDRCSKILQQRNRQKK